MHCSKCGTNNPSTNNFCAKCGTAIAKHCAKCKAENPATSDFCGECGASLKDARGTGAPSSSPGLDSGVRVATEGSLPEALDGERKTVTALFADIKGSMDLIEDIDPEEARAIVDPALKLMIDAAHHYGGYIVQSTGDGIFALFGAPIAHEDHPKRAVFAALRMQEDLKHYAEKLRERGQPRLSVRVGVNGGEVVVRFIQTDEGHTEYTPIGHSMSLASRLQTLAAPGSVVIGESVRKFVEGYFQLKALGASRIKGVSEPVNVYEVTGLGPLRTRLERSAGRGLTKFVGRERDLEQLQRALAQATDGHGQIVAVMADAGTGKSRLVYEFKRLVPQRCKVLEAYSVSHGKASAWLPVLELLRRYFGIQAADDPTTRRDKVRTALTALDAALDDALPYLFGLLGIVEGADPLAQMDPLIKRQRTLGAIKRLVLRESLNQSLVVIFEDLHWIDEQTQALLDVVADSIANAHVLLLVNYRPEYRHEWSNKSHYVQLGLNPLGRESSEELLDALLGDAVELNSLKRLVVERTGGNPFFIEEIVQTLFDEGALVRNGAVKVTRSLSRIRLPPTVQGILAARIDRQPSEHKQLLQTLSVIGREASLGLLTQIASHPDTQLERMLAELRAAEFIYEQPAAGGVEYVFKHALTQEVAYNSLLIERRKQLHERVGQALESLFAGRLDDYLGLLAHHYGRTDNFSKAVEYLERAAHQAIQRCAYADAVNNLESATGLLRKLPENPDRIQRELLLQVTLGQAYTGLKSWAAKETELAFTRALEICERLTAPPELFFVLYGLLSVYHIRGLFLDDRERSYQLLEHAKSAGDPMLLIVAHYAIGAATFHTGELLIATEHQDIVLSLYDQARDAPLALPLGMDPREGMLSYRGWTLWYLGYPDQALGRANEAIATAQSLSHPFSLASAEFFSTMIHTLRREPRQAQETGERAIAIASEHGLGFWLLFTPVFYGWAIAQHGRHEEGIEQMRQALAVAHEAGLNIARSNALCLLAEGYRNAGRLDEALDTVKLALDAADAQEERYYESEILRLKGDLLLRKTDANAEDAQRCFIRAIEIAREQSAKSWELRATTSLAQLLARLDRPDEARAMLAEIYGWFTEGFDTPDLKDAKALLDELGNLKNLPGT